MIFRDGVGDGQIQYVLDNEVQIIKETLREACGGSMPKFSFIVVSKRINTRFLSVSRVGRGFVLLRSWVVCKIMWSYERK